MSEIRVGYVGLDSSHCTAFTDLFRSLPVKDRQCVRVTAAFPGGSDDFPMSRDRVAGFTVEMQRRGVIIVSSIDELLSCVDAVIVGGVDGRQHLEHSRQTFGHGKPVFVDKPLAHTLTDALAIVELGRRTHTSWFSSSALRYQPVLGEIRATLNDDIRGCDVFGPVKAAIGHDELAWYGIHSIEAIFSLLGPRCERVSFIRTESTDLVTSVWDDGRIATFRGLRESLGYTQYGLTVIGKDQVVQRPLTWDYDGLVAEIAEFFRTEVVPVSNTETLRIMAFIAATEQSLIQGGGPLALDDVIKKQRPNGRPLL